MTLGWLLSLLFAVHSGEGSTVPDSADRRFLHQAMARGEAELKIARMAGRNAGTEEIQALAQRLSKYHIRLAAALREFAWLRKVRLNAAQDPALHRLVKSFEGKTGRAYDQAFRDLLAKDPARLLALYRAGAAGMSDRLLRRLAERVYGELKAQRPAAARAHLRQQRAAAQERRRAELAETKSAKAKTKAKPAAGTGTTRRAAKERASRAVNASARTRSSAVKRGGQAGSAEKKDEIRKPLRR